MHDATIVLLCRSEVVRVVRSVGMVAGQAAAAALDEIQRAYRELMKRVPPDEPGCSNYLASQLNEARDTLLC